MEKLISSKLMLSKVEYKLLTNFKTQLEKHYNVEIFIPSVANFLKHGEFPIVHGKKQQDIKSIERFLSHDINRHVVSKGEFQRYLTQIEAVLPWLETQKDFMYKVKGTSKKRKNKFKQNDVKRVGQSILVQKETNVFDYRKRKEIVEMLERIQLRCIKAKRSKSKCKDIVSNVTEDIKGQIFEENATSAVGVKKSPKELFSPSSPEVNINTECLKMCKNLNQQKERSQVHVNIALNNPGIKKSLNTCSNLRPIVIDGVSVARVHGRANGTFSCKGIQLCVEHFLERGHTHVTAFVPHYIQTSKKFSKVTEILLLEKLVEKQHVVFIPTRSIRGKCFTPCIDRFTVQFATLNGGVILSDKAYRNLLGESVEFRKTIEERLLMFCFVGDIFMIPSDPLGRYGPGLEKFLSFPPKNYVSSDLHRHNATDVACMPIFFEDDHESTNIQKNVKSPELCMSTSSRNFRSVSNTSTLLAPEALKIYESPTVLPKQNDLDVEYLYTISRKDSNDMELSSQIRHAYSSKTSFNNAGAATPFNDLNLNNVDEEDEFLYGDSNSLSKEHKAFENDPVEANMKLTNSVHSCEIDYAAQNLNSNVWKQSFVTNFQNGKSIVSEVPQNKNKEKLINCVIREMPSRKLTNVQFRESSSDSSGEKHSSACERNSNTIKKNVTSSRKRTHSPRNRFPPSSRHRSPPNSRHRPPSRSPPRGSRHRLTDFNRYHSCYYSPRRCPYEKRRHYSRSPVKRFRAKSPGYYRRRNRSPSFSRSQERSRNSMQCRTRDRNFKSKYHETEMNKSRKISNKLNNKTNQRKNIMNFKSEDNSSNSINSNSKESSLEKFNSKYELLIEKYKDIKTELHIAQSKVNSAAHDVVEMHKNANNVWEKTPESSSTEKVLYTKCKDILSLSTTIMDNHIKNAMHLEEELNNFKRRLPSRLLPEISEIKFENHQKVHHPLYKSRNLFNMYIKDSEAANEKREKENLITLRKQVAAVERVKKKLEDQNHKEKKIVKLKEIGFGILASEIQDVSCSNLSTEKEKENVNFSKASERSSSINLALSNEMPEDQNYKEKKVEEIGSDILASKIQDMSCINLSTEKEKIEEKENVNFTKASERSSSINLTLSNEMSEDQNYKEKKVEEIGSDILASKIQDMSCCNLSTEKENIEKKENVNYYKAPERSSTINFTPSEIEKTFSKDSTTVQKIVYIGEPVNYKTCAKNRPFI